jgi:CheY-like chemotaxis protein
MADQETPQLEREAGAPRYADDVRVLVVDDQDVFRAVLRDLVAATKGFVLVGEATSGEGALAAMPKLQPDFVVMDSLMRDMGGMDAARTLLERYPDRVVLLVSVLDLAGPAPTGPSGEAIPFVSKQDLRTSVLREVWQRHKPG